MTPKLKMMGPARVLASVTLAAAVAEETIPSEEEREEGREEERSASVGAYRS